MVERCPLCLVLVTEAEDIAAIADEGGCRACLEIDAVREHSGAWSIKSDPPPAMVTR